jgi:hypothetical protein
MKYTLKIFLFLIFLFTIVPGYAYNLNINYEFDTQIQIYQISKKSDITENFKNCEIDFNKKEETIANLKQYIKPEYKYSDEELEKIITGKISEVSNGKIFTVLVIDHSYGVLE